MAAEYNFAMEKGVVFYTAFEYKDANNQIIDLTNWCARFSMQSIDGTPTTITYLSNTTNSSYSFTIEPALGKIILQISADTTKNFNFSNARYDLDLKAPNELFPGAGPQIIRLLKGAINLIDSNVANPEPFLCVTNSDPDQCLTCE